MEAQPYIQVLNYWNVTDLGLVVELYTTSEGLPGECFLSSRESKGKWKVASRLIYNHAVDSQRRFPGEKEEMVFLSFTDAEKADHSRSKLLLNETRGVFHYIFQAEGESIPLLLGEELVLEQN